MNAASELLEERLARLAAGEPLAACLQGLAAEEQTALRLAAELRVLATLEPTPTVAAAQRQRLIHTAQQGEKRMKPQSTSTARALPWLGLAGLGVAGLALAACVLTLFVGGGLWWWSNTQNANAIAQRNAPNTTRTAQTAPDAQTALLQTTRGVVEVQNSAGAWEPAHAGQTLVAGQHLRVGPLASADLVFFDGSRTTVNAQTEMSLTELDAKTSGPRVIVFSLSTGELQNDVAPSTDPASRFEVHTPGGVGTAQGTQFLARVTPRQRSMFWVTEGAVNVTAVNVTVLVVAGQLTTINVGLPPTEPVYQINGEGQVFSIGNPWNIGGRTFAIDNLTVIEGNPQVGDWVRIEARLLANGARIATRIYLLEPDDNNEFRLSGTVSAIEGQLWTIGGRTVRTNAETQIAPGLAVGQMVLAVGTLGEDGVFLATSLQPFTPALRPFLFSGAVQSIGDTSWTISAISVTVNATTTIAPGLAVGDMVRVAGLILEDGTWVATTIVRLPNVGNEFQFTGVLEALTPTWTVSGVTFEVTAWTVIADGLAMGDEVIVRGVILPDGTWVAREIAAIDDDAGQLFSMTGRVNSLNPWVVNGIPLVVNGDTTIRGNIVVGEMVRVWGVIQPDGTWLAWVIQANGRRWGWGCFGFASAVVEQNATGIVLVNGLPLQLDDEIEVEGNLQPGSVILYTFCLDADGSGRVISIVVLYQLDVVPVIIIGGDDGDNGNPICQDGPDKNHGRGNDCNKPKDK